MSYLFVPDVEAVGPTLPHCAVKDCEAAVSEATIVDVEVVASGTVTVSDASTVALGSLSVPCMRRAWRFIFELVENCFSHPGNEHL